VRRIVCLLCLSALAAASAFAPALAAQKGAKEPKRPKLAAGADTNDAQAYYDYGIRPEVPWDKTYDAFYWAYQLEPDQPFYLFALYDALWKRQPWEWRREYQEGAEFVMKSKEAKQLDTLRYEYLIREPFAHYTGMCRYPDWIADIERESPATAGLIYYSGNCYSRAAAQFGQALAKRPKDIGLLSLRAQAHYAAAHYDSAVYDLQRLLDSMRVRDQKRLRRYYESKEMYEYMMGDAYVQLRNLPAAREAYGRALTENLAFYMAHAKLARVALAENDVNTALAELDQAVQLKPDDGVVRQTYGFALLEADRHAEAEAQFRKAIELHPHWALPYFNLALALDRQGKGPEALAEYKAFLARVPRRSFKLTRQAQGRVAALSAGASTP
jgi:tetratricopeptide (TPR) repeat protein